MEALAFGLRNFLRHVVVAGTKIRAIVRLKVFQRCCSCPGTPRKFVKPNIKSRGWGGCSAD
ncbi:MAG TPA: hypothetical protein VI199_13470 [Novosphingobium sp.]